MATVPVVSKNSLSPVVVQSILLAPSGDTLVYTRGRNEELWLFNTSSNGVNVNIDGAAGNTVVVPGTAGTQIDVSAGLLITLPANAFAFIPLERAEHYLQGVVAITATTGAVIKAVITTPY